MDVYTSRTRDGAPSDVKLLYKPFGIIVGLLAGALGRAIFSKVWGLIDEKEPPESTTLKTTWGKLVLATAVQGAIFRAVRAVVTRAGAVGYSRLTGTWPGEIEPDPE